MPASARHQCAASATREWEIALTVSVCADRSRLLSVMTIPEYMELWMHLASPSPEGKAAVREVPGGFHITGARGANEETSILANCRTSRRNKVVFAWKNQRFESASVVAIRLAGDFARTNVHLKQLGTGTEEDYRWHQFFWRQSLRRLSALFRSRAA